MKKQKSWLQWVDDNILHWSFIFFIIAVALVPKFPIEHVEYTYIHIRIDDILPAFISLVFFIQWLRKKVKLHTVLLLPVVLFWIAVFVSFAIGYYYSLTIPVFNIGLLHSLRRIQYMIVFFVASSVIVSDKRFYQYMNIYLGTLFITAVYGLFQKFSIVPSIQTMNPAYVDGRLLWLKPEDRINSTFGGHFDLAAYLSLSIPILLGFYFALKKKWYLFAFITSLIALLYTSARSSFIAYIVAVVAMLIYLRKFKFLLFTIVLTGLLLVITGDMTKRFLQTVQVKTVFVNQQTGVEQIDQKISVKNLPAGSYQVKLPFNINLGSGSAPTNEEEAQKEAARTDIYENAKRTGKYLTQQEIEDEAQQIYKNFKPQRSILCDISCSTRLQVEWPRAILAFRKNVLFGRGPSSLGEATDNDLLRWLGEFGLVGTGLFIYILFAISRKTKMTIKYITADQRFIYVGFIFGLLALFINAIYVDVFEASKVAYNFWIIAGMYVGVSVWYEKNKVH